jgi:conserved oligomeric Golgi complex subunit 2
VAGRAYELVRSELDSLVQGILDGVCEELSAECCARLQPVHTIAQTYRMAYRPDPTMPSYYVSTVLQPLKEFLRVATQCEALSTQDQRVVASLTVEPISNHFAQAQHKLWADFRQQSTLLAKMTRHRTNAPVLATTSSSKTLSDEDQIAAQLALDVRFYVGELRSLVADVDLTTLTTSQALLATVSSSDSAVAAET